MFCANCGKAVPENMRFCSACGAAVDGVGPVTAPGTTAGTAVISKQLKHEVRARSVDAWNGLKLLAADPVGGLNKSFEMLGEEKALGVAVVFAVGFEAAVFFGISRSIEQALGMFSPFGRMPGIGGGLSDLPASQLIKVLILGFVPFVSIAAAIALARAVFGGVGRLAAPAYVAGSSLLPMGIFVLVSSLLGVANVEVIAVLGMFALSYTILMLYAGCSQVLRMAERASAPAVPIVLMLSGWITKILVSAMW